MNNKLQWFIENYRDVFPDNTGTFVNNHRKCIDLIKLCQELLPMEVLPSDIPEKPVDQAELAKWEELKTSTTYYGNTETGIINVERMQRAYHTLYNQYHQALVEEFLSSYPGVFESDLKTVKACGSDKTRNLISLASRISPHKIPASQLPKKPFYESDLPKWKKKCESITYYGNLDTGFMDVQRIYELYLSLV